jgi:hypothetical protein
VDAHALVARQLRGLGGVQHARGVDAIGEQDQQALPGGLVAQALDRQRDGVADGGFASDQADHAVLQLLAHGIAVERERGQHEGALPEHDQADAVAGTAIEEIGQHRLGGGQAVDHAAAKLHVLLAHAAGQVYRQHQVAAGLRWLHDRPELLWPCRRQA